MKKTQNLRRVILWFRNDLRLHDNAIVDYAIQIAKSNRVEILPVYVFDPRFTTKIVQKYSIQKCGPIRLQFTIEAVDCLRKNLK